MMALERFAGDMCACADADCAKRVSDEMTKWSQEMAQKQEEPPTMTEAEQQQAVEIGTRMGECMQKARGAGTGQPQP